MHLDRLQIVFGAARLGRQDADDPVAVADRGHLGVGDDDRAVSEIERGDRTMLDPGRAVAHDIVEVFLQLVEHPLDPVALQGLLVPRLRSREDVKVVVPLSLISAWLSLASPFMTLIKSKTTRRSHPMIRSRLRNPTSKSITTVRLPRRASPEAIAAAEVVLPTPPLPEVSTITFANRPPPFPASPIQRCAAAPAAR